MARDPFETCTNALGNAVRIVLPAARAPRARRSVMQFEQCVSSTFTSSPQRGQLGKMIFSVRKYDGFRLPKHDGRLSAGPACIEADAKNVFGSGAQSGRDAGIGIAAAVIVAGDIAQLPVALLKQNHHGV